MLEENPWTFDGSFMIPDLDSNTIELFGNFNSDQSKQIIFAIKRCQQNCAPEHEIDAYVESLFIYGVIIEP